ncbi:MAG: DUF1080 domain-containing protein [Bacteroidetes bacterium HGW-Bacteroidetes-3]|nr:MAG: DUF1080 domain-containing protein [Bacteroidetes bacterium HGW-Bacteroidetes-3]
MRLKIIPYFIFIVLLQSFLTDSNHNQNQFNSDENWIKLFNGKDLNNWIVKIKGHPAGENYKNTFRAVEGVLQVNYDEYDTFGTSYGHIFYEKEFSNYKLRLQYRFVGEQVKDGQEWARKNSGVMIHSQSPESMGLNQDFPVSIEVQLLGGLGTEDRPTGNVCTPGTHIVINDELVTTHCINSTSKTFHGNEWVNLEVLVMNDSIITHKINGENVMTYYKPQIGGAVEITGETWKSKEGNPLKSGFISLQSESHPIEFKNIELLELH